MKKFFILMICLMIFTPYYVFGLENYETNFYFTINELEYIDYGYGSSDKTYKDFVDEIKAYNTNLYYYITFTNNVNYTNRPTNVSIVITDTIPDHTNTVIRYNVGRYTGTVFYPQFNSTSYFKYKTINYANLDYDNDIAEIKACLDNYNSCGWTQIMEGLNPQNANIQRYTDYNNNDITVSNLERVMTNLIIYSNYDLTLGSPTQAMIDDTATYLKTTYVNDNLITNKILTYYDLYYPSTPEPEPEPDDPDDPTEESNKTSWIYWFSEPEDTNGYLNNIYTLLFLYCVFMLIIKIVNSFKKAGKGGTKW